MALKARSKVTEVPPQHCSPLIVTTSEGTRGMLTPQPCAGSSELLQRCSHLCCAVQKGRRELNTDATNTDTTNTDTTNTDTANTDTTNTDTTNTDTANTDTPQCQLVQ